MPHVSIHPSFIHSSIHSSIIQKFYFKKHFMGRKQWDHFSVSCQVSAKSRSSINLFQFSGIAKSMSMKENIWADDKRPTLFQDIFLILPTHKWSWQHSSFPSFLAFFFGLVISFFPNIFIYSFLSFSTSFLPPSLRWDYTTHFDNFVL